MAENPAQERTEAPSARRQQEARAKGQIARSREVPTVFVLAAGLAALKIFGPTLLAQTADICRHALAMIPRSTLTAETAVAGARQLALALGLMLAPICLPIAVAGVAANLIQGGAVFSLEPLAPKLERIHPARGFQRLMSTRSFIGLAKALLQVAVVGGVCWITVRDAFPDFVLLLDQGPRQLLAFAGGVTLRIGFRVTAVLALLALADFVYERWEFQKTIRMTRQELKEEYKETEGDPLVRSRLRAFHRERTRRRMLREVRRADVVVTNPVHVAVALRYDEHTMRAPEVVAKGARLLAGKIRELARQHGVPVVEDPPLAWALYRTAPLGAEIPIVLYRAVAEVLAMAYRLRGRRPLGRE